jgi:hypothetical protein
LLRPNMASLKGEHEWLVKHHAEAEKHSGRWIAIFDRKIVADGRSFGEAHKKATRKHPKQVPLVLYVPKKDEELLIL